MKIKIYHYILILINLELKISKYFLIKEYEVCDKLHLESKEQLYMNKIKNINKVKSFQPLAKEQNKQTDIIYRKNNKDKKANYDKEYREKNKEKLKDSKKEYNKLKFICECGSNIIKRHLSDHIKTKKHIKFINSSL